MFRFVVISTAMKNENKMNEYGTNTPSAFQPVRLKDLVHMDVFVFLHVLNGAERVERLGSKALLFARLVYMRTWNVEV